MVYAISRMLTSTEKNYAQIKKELSSVCFVMEKFQLFIYEHTNVIVRTDHKPLLPLLKKTT